MRDSIREKLNDRKGITTVEWALLLVLVIAFVATIWSSSRTPTEEQETSQAEYQPLTKSEWLVVLLMEKI